MATPMPGSGGRRPAEADAEVVGVDGELDDPGPQVVVEAEHLVPGLHQTPLRLPLQPGPEPLEGAVHLAQHRAVADQRLLGGGRADPHVDPRGEVGFTGAK